MTCYRPQPAMQAYNPLTKSWSRPRIIYPLARGSDSSRIFPRAFGACSSVATRSPQQKYITLPCGLCFGCRCDNSRMWSLRMMHELRYHDHNYFITLTYDDDNLPSDAVLKYKDLSNFFKRARHEFQTVDRPFKYFACGEYGDKSLRPHYHFAGFDFKIPDLRPFRQVGSSWYFLSDALRDCWKHGHVIVGDLSWSSAAYMARYVTKKMHGSNIRTKPIFDPLTGEFEQYPVERAFQSKGLGLPFYREHSDEIWNLDGCLFKGQYLVKPPAYYFKKLAEEDPDRALQIKEKRAESKEITFIDQDRDKELLYSMEAKRLHMQTLLSRSL